MMMQVTRAAFQTVVSLTEHTTDTKSHTSVKNAYTLSFLSCHLQIPMVDPFLFPDLRFCCAVRLRQVRLGNRPCRRPGEHALLEARLEAGDERCFERSQRHRGIRDEPLPAQPECR